jgi:hypothetical protein
LDADPQQSTSDLAVFRKGQFSAPSKGRFAPQNVTLEFIKIDISL